MSLNLQWLPEIPVFVEWCVKIGGKILETLDGSKLEFYEEREAGVRDISKLYQLFRKEFRDEAPRREALVEWLKANPKHLVVVIKVIERGLVTKKKIVGAYKVLRINRGAAELLDQEHLSGTGFRSEHFVAADEAPYAIYIGDVIGAGKIARGHVMGHLVNFLQAQRDSGVQFFYARPLSDEGLGWCQKYSFFPVNSMHHGEFNHIYRRDNATGSVLLRMRPSRVGNPRRSRRRR
jgi:hypothetical protein